MQPSALCPIPKKALKSTKTQQTNKIATTFEKMGRAKNPRIVNGGAGRVGGGEDSRLGSGSKGELGRLEPMLNLVLDFRLSLYLCAEAECGECVLDDDFGFVRCDNGCKNGGENGGPPPPPGFWSWLSDELRCGFEETRFGCDCECWYGFR